MPKLSIAIPFYKGMKNADFFLNRALDSIKTQSFKDYEVVITEHGAMAENTNFAIKHCKGDLIKILYQDDYLADENSLQVIIDAFKGGWLVTGCKHDNGMVGNYHEASYSPNENTIGSPSVLTIGNKDPLMFDENMTWLLDLDYYNRLYERYGEPTIISHANVIIGLHDGQATNILSDEIKINEQNYLNKKHDKRMPADV